MSLQIWLPLNGSTINQGVAGFQPAAADIVYTNSGKIGAQACSGGAVSMTAAQTASIFNNNEITIAFWIKPLNATSGGIIFGNESMAANNNRKFSLFQYHNSQTHPNMVGTSLHWSWMNDAAEQTFTSGIIENCLPVNVWTHVCVAYKNPNIKIYINGEEVKTVSSVISNSSSFEYNTTILNSNSNRHINDLRVYDHALSALEVKQLSQGLVIHYTFDDVFCEPTTNYLIYPQPGSSVTNSYGWDKNLHKDAIAVNGWGSGYNSGVSNANQVINPQEGYHAMWQLIEGIPTIVFNNLNSTWNSLNRWLGISGGIDTTTRMLLPSKTITVSYEAKSLTAGMRVGIGLYHYKTGTTNAGFYSNNGNTAKYQNTTTEWKTYSDTFTVLNSFDTSKTASIYVYGHGGSEGITYVRNLQLEINDHATAYTPNTRNSMLYNEAGFVQPSGVNNLSLSSNSRIGKYCGKFNGTNTYIDTPIVKSNMFTDNYTLNFWVYHNEGDGRAVYFGDYETTNKMQLNIERTADKKLRYYHAANPDYNFNLTIPDKQWTMVTLKYVKSETKLYAYLNGDINNKQSLSHTPTLTKTSGIIKIGMDGRPSPGVTPLNGYIDDFRFYCSALSDNDIQDLYNCGASLSDLGDAHANNFIENATYHGVDEEHNVQANEIYEDILGKDYQQLEYLEATGTQYINTGFAPNNNTHIQITYKSNTDGLKALFGARTASNRNVFTAWVQEGKIYTHYGNRDYNAISPISGDIYQKFIYNQNKNIGTVLFNNSVEGSAVSSEALFNSGCNLTLLAVNSNGTIDDRRSIGYLYSCQLYDNGTLIRDYYPARRVSDNILGLYDVVGKTFYTNAGTGNFKAGPTVTVNETSAFTENKNFTSRQIIEI